MVTPVSYSNKEKAQQHQGELDEFLKFIRTAQIHSYCEVGCKFGALLWQVAHAMASRGRVVAVDLPNNAWGRDGSAEPLHNCILELRRIGYDAHLFIGDSTAPPIVENVKKLAPFDMLFIDANHTEAYVRADFSNYGKLTKTLCFHDIGWNKVKPPGKKNIEVPKVWREIKEKHQAEATFREIKLDDGHNGIGILQWN